MYPAIQKAGIFPQKIVVNAALPDLMIYLSPNSPRMVRILFIPLTWEEIIWIDAMILLSMPMAMFMCLELLTVMISPDAAA